jgi:CheY-like chemotaxis protein
VSCVKQLTPRTVFNPDLILLDVLMPGMNGREVLRHVRRAGDWTPVILLTRVGDATERWMTFRLSFVRAGLLLLLIFTGVWQGHQAYAEAESDVTLVEPTEMYVVEVDGPNLTGEVPPLDRAKAIALHDPNP